MRAITKGQEPTSLTAHRQAPHSDYANYGEKKKLRAALVAEQRGLCCYCMGRIKAEPALMKIEHWRSRSRYPNLQLDYRNLLAACPGQVGGISMRPTHLQHCDTKKGDGDLEWNPANPAHHIETRIRYGVDGSISSNEASFNDQLNNVLNLNLPVLKNNRKSVLAAVLDWWQREKARTRGPVPRNRFVRELNKRVDGDGELAPYCQVAVWWLQQRLSRMSA